MKSRSMSRWSTASKQAMGGQRRPQAHTLSSAQIARHRKRVVTGQPNLPAYDTALCRAVHTSFGGSSNISRPPTQIRQVEANDRAASKESCPALSTAPAHTSVVEMTISYPAPSQAPPSKLPQRDLVRCPFPERGTCCTPSSGYSPDALQPPQPHQLSTLSDCLLYLLTRFCQTDQPSLYPSSHCFPFAYSISRSSLHHLLLYHSLFLIYISHTLSVSPPSVVTLFRSALQICTNKRRIRSPTLHLLKSCDILWFPFR